MLSRYAVALGSNQRHGRHGGPPAVLRAAARELEKIGEIVALSPIIETEALGPAGRRFANAALILQSADDPLTLLDRLKALEKAFGRRRGRRWGPRVLDLDIILWSEGQYRRRRLVIPHSGLRARLFVLKPLAAIAPDWSVPSSSRAVRHLLAVASKRRRS